jgi:chromosome partitioning protein
MILTVGNVKGGVGKTTLAINIAIAAAESGADVLLIDGDEQGTAMTFTELRQQETGKTDYTAVSLTGKALRQQVRKLAPKYDTIVIDVGGRDTGSFRAALTVTEILLIPVLPRTFDVWALDQVASLIEEAREINEALKVFSVINSADPVGRDNEEAAQLLAEQADITHISKAIVRRKAFSNAASAGVGIFELQPRDRKAEMELTEVLQALNVYRNDIK